MIDNLDSSTDKKSDVMIDNLEFIFRRVKLELDSERMNNPSLSNHLELIVSKLFSQTKKDILKTMAIPFAILIIICSLLFFFFMDFESSIITANKISISIGIYLTFTLLICLAIILLSLYQLKWFKSLYEYLIQLYNDKN